MCMPVAMAGQRTRDGAVLSVGSATAYAFVAAVQFYGECDVTGKSDGR